MWRLALAFVDIALHRRGPEDLPSSRFLVALIVCVYLLVGLATLHIGTPLEEAVGMLLFDSALYIGFVWLILRLAGRARRFNQTITALLGTETFLNLLLIPPLLMAGPTVAAENLPMLPRLLFLLLFLWSVDIAGYILSRALDRPYVLGLLIVLVYVTGSISLRALVSPVEV